MVDQIIVPTTITEVMAHAELIESVLDIKNVALTITGQGFANTLQTTDGEKKNHFSVKLK